MRITKLKTVFASKKKMVLIFLSILIVIVASFSFFLSIHQNSRPKESQIDKIVNDAFPDGKSGKQKDWALDNIQRLKKSKLSQSKNNKDLTEYYSKLFGYYMVTSSAQEAKDTYLSEVKPKSVQLQVSQLEWLLSVASTSDQPYIKIVTDDELKLLKQKLASVEDRDKQEISEKIKYYEDGLRAIQ